jgi:hypothetical protein
MSALSSEIDTREPHIMSERVYKYARVVPLVKRYFTSPGPVHYFRWIKLSNENEKCE